MTQTTAPQSRTTTCERCGKSFGCTLNGPCWCGAEPFRMPLPAPGQSEFSDCLCPDCLQEVAAATRAAR